MRPKRLRSKMIRITRNALHVTNAEGNWIPSLCPLRLTTMSTARFVPKFLSSKRTKDKSTKKALEALHALYPNSIS